MTLGDFVVSKMKQKVSLTVSLNCSGIVCGLLYLMKTTEHNKNNSVLIEHTALFPWFCKLTIDYSASTVKLLTFHLFTALQFIQSIHSSVTCH